MKGWSTQTIEEIIISSGTRDPRKNPDEIFDYVDVSSVSNEVLKITETQKLLGNNAPSRARRIIKEGDVIFATVRPTLRRIATVPERLNDQVCSTGYFVFRVKEQVHNKFLFYFLQTDTFMGEMEKLQSGASYPAVNDSQVKQQSISYPPINEQKRIVAILDQAFAEIERARANAQQNLNNARELFESYLQQVFSQRGDGWKREKLDNLGKITSSKRIYKREYVASGIPFYRTKEIKQLANNEKISTELFISEERFNEIKGKFGAPVKGDVLMTAIGTIGEIYVVEGVTDFYFKDGNVLWLKDFSDINSGFLKYALLAFVAELNLLAKGAAYNALPIEKLKKYEIRVPSEEEQADLVKNLDYIRQQSSELHEVYIDKLNSLDELKKSILQKAFTGELTKEVTR